LAPAIAATRRGDRDEALRRLGSAILGPQAFRRLSSERLAQARANLIDAELLGSLFPPLTASQIRTVRCPVLLVTGDQSPPVLHHLSHLLGQLLPNVERVRFASASHLVHEDQPPAFAAAVLSFLSEQRARPESSGQGRRARRRGEVSA
jgi:pimeloyl-ACP methyl ester carboxylesterase